MPTIANLGATSTTESRAQDAWSRIQEKPTSVVLVRGDTALTAQTVRIEYDSTATEVEGAAGMSSERDVTIFGVSGHPTITNTDIQREDRFVFNGSQYRVISVIPQTGEVQAQAKVQK